MTSPVANILVEFIDGQGRTWRAAGYLGPLQRFEGPLAVESLPPGKTREQEMRIASLKVIEDA